MVDEFSSVLAYHYAKAESWEKAQAYLFKTGDQAGRIAADAEALTHYQQALETYAKVFGDKWDPIQRGILERKMGEAFYRRGEWEKAMEYLQRAFVYFGQPKLPVSRSKVRLGILREMGVQVRHRIFSRSLATRTNRPAKQEVEEVMRIYAIILTHDSATAPERFLLTNLACLNFSERNGYAPGIACQFASLVLVCSYFSLFRLARFFLQRAMVLARQTQDPEALVVVQLHLTVSEDNAGRLDKAIDAGLKGVEIARTRGYWQLALWGSLLGYLALAHYHRGDTNSALTVARETIRFGEDVNEPFIVAMGLMSLGYAQERMGDFQEGVATLTKVIELAEAIPNHLTRVVAASSLGRCYCRMGDIEKGMAVLTEDDTYRAEHGVRGWDYFLATALFATYLAAAGQGRGPQRDEYLRKARQACKRVFRSAKGYPVCLPETTRLQGIYDWLRDRQASAQKHWQQSLGLAEEMGMRYDLAMTHLEMGRHLNDQSHLLKAEAIFADIGAEFDLAATRKLLEKAAERKEA